MKSFEYIAPKTLDEALAILSDDEGTRLFAGGTDLLGEMKRGVIAPEKLLDLKSVGGLEIIRQEPDGGLAIGSLATLSEIAENPLVKQSYPLLVQAIEQTASPQIRNVATLGGNLCQRPRCWYYRHPDFPCLRKHGESCFAVWGNSRYHAIWGGNRCFIVHRSDPAAALMALDAHTQIAYSEGIRAVPLREFFVTPGENLTQETVLQPNEILTGIKLPPPLPNARGIYLKVAERKATDFALASVALHLAWEGTRINHARVVLGSVAPVPWRLQHVEEILLGDELSQDFDKALPTPSKEKIQLACEGAVEGAKQIRHNGYKIPLVKGLLRKALRLVFESQLGTKIEEETE